MEVSRLLWTPLVPACPMVLPTVTPVYPVARTLPGPCPHPDLLDVSTASDILHRKELDTNVKTYWDSPGFQTQPLRSEGVSRESDLVPLLGY